MAFPPLSGDPEIERRRRRRRLIRAVVGALVLLLVVVAAVRTWDDMAGKRSTAHVATKTVTVTSAERHDDGMHVRARLDAPSPSGKSHELEGVVPSSTWDLTQVVWACYPPADPDKGELRTPLDPDCTNLFDRED